MTAASLWLMLPAAKPSDSRCSGNLKTMIQFSAKFDMQGEKGGEIDGIGPESPWPIVAAGGCRQVAGEV